MMGAFAIGVMTTKAMQQFREHKNRAREATAVTWTPDEEAFLRAMVTKGAERPREAADRIGPERAYALASGALAVAAARRFPSGSTHADIAAFARSLPERFPRGAEMFKPTVVEAVIRTARGEEGLLAGLDVADVQQLLLILPHTLMADQEISDGDRETFIDESLKMAADS